MGIRLAFEVPSDLPANWIFTLWIEPDGELPRQVARRVLLTFSLGWLAPLCFLYSALLWGWLAALLQTVLLIACSVVFVEVLLVRFRKIPFTCSYPAFQSQSTLVLVAYLIDFVAFAIYIPRIVQWSLEPLVSCPWFSSASAACVNSVNRCWTWIRYSSSRKTPLLVSEERSADL